MFGLFKKKPEELTPDNSVSFTELSKSISDPAPVTKEPEPLFGSYRVVPAAGPFNQQFERELLYQVVIYGFNFHGYSGNSPTWYHWQDVAGNYQYFKTIEEAEVAFKEFKRKEHKVLMHLQQEKQPIRNPFYFILDEVKELGINARLVEEEKKTKLVFPTEEEMNFYKLSAKYLEVDGLKFVVEKQDV